MAILIRLAVGIVLAVGFFLIYRKFSQGTGRIPRRDLELEMPYCLKCESNRQVVINPGDYFPPQQYPWYCQRCREFF